MNASSGSFFFFNDTATTEIYTLSLHDALPVPCPRPGFEPTKHWAACSGARELNHSATGPAHKETCFGWQILIPYRARTKSSSPDKWKASWKIYGDRILTPMATFPDHFYELMSTT